MNNRIYGMAFAGVYGAYVKKAERKGRTADEADAVICWLTGYDEQGLRTQIAAGVSVEQFFAAAPNMNPNADLIKGSVCGCRVEEVTEPLMRKIRQMDKLVDELANGKPMERILRG